MSTFVDLLGPELIKDGKTIATADALSGKLAVGLYFSAHWCPPCRGFTPKLSEAYKNHLNKKGLEIVFISSDRTEEDFNGYFGEQPWLALPYSSRDKKSALNKKFKVQGIPSLVVLDCKTGETITVDGREAVSEDWEGKDLPWRPPSFWEALGTEFLKGTEGDTVDIDEIKGEGKVIGLYFSAHWCPPCKGFTPSLIDSYTQHLKAKNLEIIFVSSDRDQAAFQEYYATMPWLAIPQGDPRKAKLSRRFGVEGIPSLVLVDASTGETINANARGKISSDPEGKDFPFHPKPLVDLNDDASGINDEVALVALLDGCDESTTAAAEAALAPLAAAAKAAKEDTLFYYAPKSGPIVQRVRELAKLAKAGPKAQMLILDIPDDGGYYVSPAEEVTADTVTAFLEGYKAKTLERQQLGG